MKTDNESGFQIWFNRFLFRLFCRHEHMTIRHIYGDEVIMTGYKRQKMTCNDCGKSKYK